MMLDHQMIGGVCMFRERRNHLLDELGDRLEIRVNEHLRIDMDLQRHQKVALRHQP